MKWLNLAKMSKNSDFSKYELVQAQNFIDLVISSNEKSRCVDMPFYSFVHHRLQEMARFGQNVQKQRFFEIWACTGSKFHNLVISSNERGWSVDVPFKQFRPDSATGSWSNLAKILKSCVFFSKHKHIRNIQCHFGTGEVRTFLFHKFFLVFQ